jgi:CRP-like cAMP-binding protein
VREDEKSRFDEILRCLPRLQVNKIMGKLYKYNDALFHTISRTIKNVPCFTNLHQTTLRSMIFRMKRLKLSPGKVLIQNQEVMQKFFIVFSGSLKVQVIDSNGEKFFFQELKEGSAINVSNCILNHWSIFEVEANEPSVVMEISLNELQKIAKKDIELYDSMKSLHKH